MSLLVGLGWVGMPRAQAEALLASNSSSGLKAASIPVAISEAAASTTPSSGGSSVRSFLADDQLLLVASFGLDAASELSPL